MSIMFSGCGGVRDFAGFWVGGFTYFFAVQVGHQT
jgi:hypothetical protein